MNKLVAILLFAASGSVFAGDVDAQGLQTEIDANPVASVVDTGVDSSRLDIDQDAIQTRYNIVITELDEELRKDLDAIIDKEISMMIELDQQHQDRTRYFSAPTYVIL